MKYLLWGVCGVLFAMFSTGCGGGATRGGMTDDVGWSHMTPESNFYRSKDAP